LARSVRFALFPVVALVAGCNFSLGSSTGGEDGRAQFSYDGLDGCFFGCDTNKPLMLGTKETILVEGDLTLGMSILSDNPAIFTVGQPNMITSCCQSADTCSGGPTQSTTCTGVFSVSYSVDIQAIGQGSAQLVVRAADGSVFDALPLVVEPPAALRFQCPASNGAAPASSSVILVDGSCNFQVAAFDASGNAMQASEGFAVSSQDPTVVSAQTGSFLSPPDGPDGELVAVGPGSTSIVVRAGALSQTFAVTVR
jgi:hypothetical protein